MIWRLALLSAAAALTGRADATGRIGHQHDRVVARHVSDSSLLTNAASQPASTISPAAASEPSIGLAPSSSAATVYVPSATPAAAKPAPAPEAIPNSPDPTPEGFGIQVSEPNVPGLTTRPTPKTDVTNSVTSVQGVGTTKPWELPVALPSTRSSGTVSVPGEVKEPESLCGATFCTSRLPVTTTSGNGSWWTMPLNTSTDDSVSRFPITNTSQGGPGPKTVDEGSVTSAEWCTHTKEFEVPTSWSIVYTSTTTLYGPTPDYTPEFAPITTPVPCPAPVAESGRPSYDFSISCTTIRNTESCTTETLYKVSWPVAPGRTTTTARAALRQTVTFLTTDKNPSVVYAPDTQPPDYGHTSRLNDHTSVAPENLPQRPISNRPAPESMKSPSVPDFRLTAMPTVIVINDKSVTVAPDATTTTNIDGTDFVINPSQVVGAGATVDRPGAFVGLPPPTSTNVNGLAVVITSAQAIVGGATFSIGPTPTTVIISGQTISIGTAGVGVGGSVTVGAPPPPTEVVVAGGEMLTAIGASVVVIRSSTITYGPGTVPRTEVLDDDTVVIGPSGVVVHGTTLGGPRANARDTAYEIVGGATITQIGASVVVVGGATYTVGPGRGRTTTVVGGETVTIGPEGVAVSTLSFAYPFGPTVITTIKPRATGAAPTPSETGKNGAVGGPAAGPGRGGWVVVALGMAIGLWYVGSAA